MAARIPLENHQLERAVLGTLISDTLLFWQMKDRVQERLFTVVTHAKIVQILHALVEEGRELNIPSIISRFGKDDNSEFNLGGYLATLVADEGDSDQLPDFMRDLEDMSARREMARLGTALIQQSTEDNGLDAMGRLEAAKESIESLGDPMGSSVRHIGAIAQELLTRVDEASRKEETVGLECGIKGVQDLVGTFMPGRVYLIAGPPGSGKTALAYQIAAFMAQTVPVLFEEIEMEGEELVERDLAGRTGIPADRIERASLNVADVDKLMEAAEKLIDLKLYIDSSTNPTVASIRSKAMRMKRLKGLGALFIDHMLYLAPMDRKKGEFENIRINAQAIKKMAKDLGIPVIVLGQLKKEFGDGPWQAMRRPTVGDIYGGSAPEQESDVVLMVHREEYLLGRKEPAKDAKDRADWEFKRDKVAGMAEVVLGKRRGGAGFGVRTLYFEGSKTRFSDQAPRNAMQPGVLNAEDKQALLDM